MVDPEIPIDTVAVTLGAVRGAECGASGDPGCNVDQLVLAATRTGPGTGAALGLVGAGKGSLELGNTGLIGRKSEGFGPSRLPTVRVAAATVEGPLDQELVRRIVRAHLSKLRPCYESALKTNATLAGRVTVDFVIATSGKVSSAKVGAGSVDEGVGACMVKAVKDFVFPKPKGGEVTVSYPFTLAPGSG